MPTYEYVCSSCGRHVEVVQGFSDEPLERCNECGGRLRRVFHPVGVLFKGSGFYSTDAKSKKVPSGKSDGKGEKGETPKKEAPKTGSERASES